MRYLGIDMDQLDNPAWLALTTAQAVFAVGGGGAKRYRKGVLPFAALGPQGEVAELDALMDAGEAFFLIGELPELPGNWVLELELPCAQMLAPEDGAMRVDGPGADGALAGGRARGVDGMQNEAGEEIVSLGEGDKMEMFKLVQAVQPGYYLPDTRQLGDYFGIRVDGRLAAIAGERMRPGGFSEISAVCTSPEFTGRGYAQRLMMRVMRAQVDAGVMPFLHVSKANTRALRLYEHMGFVRRRDITFWRIRKTNG